MARVIDVPAVSSPWAPLSDADTYAALALVEIEANLASARRSLDEVAHRNRERAYNFSAPVPVDGSAEAERLQDQWDATFGTPPARRKPVDLSAGREPPRRVFTVREEEGGRAVSERTVDATDRQLEWEYTVGRRRRPRAAVTIVEEGGPEWDE